MCFKCFHKVQKTKDRNFFIFSLKIASISHAKISTTFLKALETVSKILFAIDENIDTDTIFLVHLPIACAPSVIIYKLICRSGTSNNCIQKRTQNFGLEKLNYIITTNWRFVELKSVFHVPIICVKYAHF